MSDLFPLFAPHWWAVLGVMTVALVMLFTLAATDFSEALQRRVWIRVVVIVLAAVVGFGGVLIVLSQLNVIALP